MGRLLPVLVLWPLAMAPLCHALGRKSRAACGALAIFACGVELALAAALCVGVAGGTVYEWALPGFGGFGLSLRMDGFRAIYADITAFMWLAATLLGREYFAHAKRAGRFHLFSLLTLSATVGVFLSADLLTTFLFFEWVSLCSYALVAHDESPAALRAAGTYLAVAVMGGLAMLMGLALLYGAAGTLVISELAAACAAVDGKGRLYLAAALLLVGFGAKAGLLPLHIWLPKAHPAAPAPASALLSGVLTKTGVFGVLVVGCQVLPGDVNWGVAMLVLGLVTMVLGAVLALFSNDLKRTLACSSISQIGFITVGVAAQLLLGSHNALAVRGTLLHMVGHSLGKLVLFGVAGVVYSNLHKLDLNEIRGFGRGKPLLAGVFLTGALSVAGVPLLGGYVSKTLLHESLVECVHLFEGLPLGVLLQAAEVLFLLAGGLTVAYMAKLFIAIFVQKPAGDMAPQKGRCMTPLTGGVLVASALPLAAMGLLPHLLAEPLAALGEGFMHGHAPQHAVHYFAWVNLKGAIISLAVGAAVYLLVVRGFMMRGGRYLERWPAWLDLEERVYRPLLRGLAAGGGAVLGWLADVPDRLVRLVRATLLKPSRPRPIGRFYEKYYWLFYPQKEKPPDKTSLTGSFSFGLLLLGLGLCAVLGWMLWVL